MSPNAREKLASYETSILLGLTSIGLVLVNWIQPSLAVRRALWLTLIGQLGVAVLFFQLGGRVRLAYGCCLVGTALNAAVFLTNDCMPVPAEIWIEERSGSWWCVMTEESRLVALADVWWGWSIGDFFVTLGLFLVGISKLRQ